MVDLLGKMFNISPLNDFHRFVDQQSRNATGRIQQRDAGLIDIDRFQNNGVQGDGSNSPYFLNPQFDLIGFLHSCANFRKRLTNSFFLPTFLMKI